MRKEAGRIEELYLQFSARKTVFLAAFTQQTGRVESNVPFAIAENGAAVAAAYGVPANELSVIVISPDGNVDLTSTKVGGRSAHSRCNRQHLPGAVGQPHRSGRLIRLAKGTICPWT